MLKQNDHNQFWDSGSEILHGRRFWVHICKNIDGWCVFDFVTGCPKKIGNEKIQVKWMFYPLNIIVDLLNTCTVFITISIIRNFHDLSQFDNFLGHPVVFKKKFLWSFEPKTSSLTKFEPCIFNIYWDTDFCCLHSSSFNIPLILGNDWNYLWYPLHVIGGK